VSGTRVDKSGHQPASKAPSHTDLMRVCQGSAGQVGQWTFPNTFLRIVRGGCVSRLERKGVFRPVIGPCAQMAPPSARPLAENGTSEREWGSLRGEGPCMTPSAKRLQAVLSAETRAGPGLPRVCAGPSHEKGDTGCHRTHIRKKRTCCIYIERGQSKLRQVMRSCRVESPEHRPASPAQVGGGTRTRTPLRRWRARGGAGPEPEAT
jgi:hypothetical protein